MIHLPLSSKDVLNGLSPKRTVELEQLYGNGDYLKILNLLGVAGPFTVHSPWELKDPKDVIRINAASFAASPFGEHYPPLIEFITEFLSQHKYMLLPQTALSEWRAALEANLIHLLASLAPSHRDSQIFFANSGTEAIEAAIKFVRAFKPKCKYLINFKRAYHGKTLGALSLTPNEEYQAPFRPLLNNIITLPFGDFQAFEDCLQKFGASNVAAVILEPIQGEAGVIIPPQSFLQSLGKLCQKHEILVVADEIQTGLGRSGYYFASIEWGGLEPDIITLAKPLGGGILPVSATIARKDIYKKMLGGLKCKSHSTTMGGNALGMAIGLKSLELIVENNLALRARQLEQTGLTYLQALQKNYPKLIAAVRGFGMLFALQFQPVIATKWLPGQADLIGELSGILAFRALHQGGIQANFSLNAMSTVRLTPALTMPDNLFFEMFNKLEQTVSSYQASRALFTKTPLPIILALAKAAL